MSSCGDICGTEQPDIRGKMELDPNDDLCPASFYAWVSLGDFWQLPHIYQYGHQELGAVVSCLLVTQLR